MNPAEITSKIEAMRSGSHTSITHDLSDADGYTKYLLTIRNYQGHCYGATIPPKFSLAKEPEIIKNKKIDPKFAGTAAADPNKATWSTALMADYTFHEYHERPPAGGEGETKADHTPTHIPRTCSMNYIAIEDCVLSLRAARKPNPDVPVNQRYPNGFVSVGIPFTTYLALINKIYGDTGYSCGLGSATLAPPIYDADGSIVHDGLVWSNMSYVKASGTTVALPPPTLIITPPVYSDEGFISELPTYDATSTLNVSKTLTSYCMMNNGAGGNFDCCIFVRPTIWKRLDVGTNPANVQGSPWTISLKIKDIRVYTQNDIVKDKISGYGSEIDSSNVV